MPLGTGDNRGVIYERGGTRRLFEIPAQSSLDWNRVLDGISRANVSATPAAAEQAGMTWAECCGLLASIEPWTHELVIYRDDERVWEGPVRRVPQNRGGLTVQASDVLGWTERRTVLSREPGAGVAVSVRAEAVLSLQRAFATHDPNVYAYVTTLGADTVTTTREVKASSGYYSTDLDNLVSAGLFYTVVGRKPLLWTDPTYVLGRTSILNPTEHLIGDVEVAKEGDLLTTQAVAVNDDSEVGTAGSTDTAYGLLQRLVNAHTTRGVTALASAATAYRARHYPVPRTLTIPQGAALHCDAPFTIRELVPGVLTEVHVEDLCWPLRQTMQLTEVKITQTAGTETVGVSYAPLAGSEED